MGELHLAKGRIIVHAKGYWFTSGGEKGAFGHSPHLKDRHGMPLYPDTQVHGDLRMAAKWLCKLKGDGNEFVNKIFGADPIREYRDTAGSIFITDLKPVGNSPTFQIKPRIEIDEQRTNKDQMLVNLELAYFEGTTLSADVYADVYMGYFENQDTMNLSKGLLNESAQLLSGFGAFRSRGYGRGKVTIEWVGDICVKGDQAAAASPKEDFILFLEPLVNFRNKDLEPGKGQLLGCQKYISLQQFRGWFAKAYNKLYDDWPSVEEMRTITFHDFYPSLLQRNTHALGYPVPMSTIGFENGDIEDRWGSTSDNSEVDKKRGKPKSISSNAFVTAGDNPQIIKLETEKRMRNSTEDNFATKKDEGGLFSQEFITQDNVFGGRVRLQKIQTDFWKKALFLLSHADILPIINGCLFRKHIRYDEEVRTADTSKPYLVVSPVNYDDSLVSAFPNQITIASLRQYNVTLKRPRRNRIAILPRSVISCGGGDKTIQWSGFNKVLSDQAYGSKTITRITDQRIAKGELTISEMSRSQAGQLREFLSPEVTYAFLKQIISERLRKYKSWEKEKISKKLIPEPVLLSIFTILNDESRGEFQRLKDAKELIESLISEHKKNEWSKSLSRVGTKFAKEARKKGYAHD